MCVPTPGVRVATQKNRKAANGAVQYATRGSVGLVDDDQLTCNGSSDWLMEGKGM